MLIVSLEDPLLSHQILLSVFLATFEEDKTAGEK